VTSRQNMREGTLRRMPYPAASFGLRMPSPLTLFQAQGSGENWGPQSACRVRFGGGGVAPSCAFLRGPGYDGRRGCGPLSAESAEEEDLLQLEPTQAHTAPP
jgi:hypothetical protein